MSEFIITCGGCGKRYRGAPGKNFKCGACSNQLTIPDTPQAAPAGKILCSNCWTEIDIQEGLAVCPACDEKVSPTIGGKAVVPAAAAGSGSHPPASASGMQSAAGDQADMQKRLTETLRERDEAIDARKKQDKVIGDLMAQLAFAKATQAAAAKEADEPARWELQMEVGELRSRLESMENQFKAAVRERDEARKAREEVDEGRRKLEARAAELEGQLATAAQERAQAATLKTGAQPNPELDRKLAQLEQDVAAARDERAAAIKERDEALAKMTQAQSDLDHFREAAVLALEPLGVEYNKSMKELITESDALISKARQQHEEANQRMGQLEALGASLKEHLLMVRREMAQRLAQVLGSPAEESAVQPAVDGPPKDGDKPDTPSTAV